MRVCHPGPVDRQRAITSAGSRIVISLRGFAETGRPPFLTTARVNISGVSSGSSLNSRGLMACESTRRKSDLKKRRDAGLFAGIGFPHAEYVSSFAARRVADYDQPPCQESIADDPGLAVVFAGILDFQSDAFKDDCRVLERQAARRQGGIVLRSIERDTRDVIVTTTTKCRKAPEVSESGRGPKPKFTGGLAAAKRRQLGPVE